MFRVAYSVVRDTSHAEDIAQEVFLQVHRSLDQYEFKGLKSWISRIALHKAIDYKRKLDRHREEVVENIEIAAMASGDQRNFSIAQDIGLQVILKDRRERIRRQLDEIPYLHRDVILAYYMEEKSYEQIATEQNISLKTVESRLYRARQWLRTHWKEEDW